MAEIATEDVRKYLSGLGFSESKASTGHVLFAQDSTGTRFVLPQTPSIAFPTVRALEQTLVGRGVVSPAEFQFWLQSESPDLAQARYASATKWFETNFTVSTYMTLESLWSVSLDSRRALAQDTADRLFWPAARAPEGAADPLSPVRARQMIIAELQLLLFVFLAIEDLGRIVNAVQRPMPDFPRELMSVSPSQALRTFAKLAKRPARRLWNVFPFTPPRSYGLKGRDAAAFTRYNNASANAARQLFALVAEFIRRNGPVYEHYVHGGTFSHAAQAVGGTPGIDYVVGVQTRPDKPDTLASLPVGPLVIERMLLLISQLVSFSRLLVERRMQIAEFVGKVPPVLLAGRPASGGRLLDAFTLGGVPFERVVDQQGRAILAGMERVDIRVKVQAEVDVGFKDHVAFFQRDWTLQSESSEPKHPLS
jgi:hypothetical protein